MYLKSGRFGDYMLCENEECKNTRKILKNGEIAPPREDPIHLVDLKCTKSDDYFLLRDGASGIFLAASSFPKSRETRAPYIDELVKFKKLLNDKIKYLASAPTKDDDGNRTYVRYSRKTKEQYVGSMKNDKPTSWKIFYNNGKWIK